VDLQPAKQPVEIVGSRQVVIVLQRGQPQAFAKPARAQEQQLTAGLFQQRNPVGAINVEIAFLADFAEVGNAIGKTHGDLLGVQFVLIPTLQRGNAVGAAPAARVSLIFP